LKVILFIVTANKAAGHQTSNQRAGRSFSRQREREKRPLLQGKYQATENFIDMYTHGEKVHWFVRLFGIRLFWVFTVDVT
jgi:hypothetical protein